MVWKLEDGGDFAWPANLMRNAHVKGNKAGEIEDILVDLETAKKLHDGIGDFPFAPKKATEEAAVRWGEDALSFFNGPKLKKLTGSLKIISTRVGKAAQNKKLGKDAKTSLKSIGATIDEHVDSVAQTTILPQINKITRSMVEADREFVLKSLKTLFTSFKGCAGRKHPEIAEAAKSLARWSDDPTEQQKIRVDVGNKMTTACRDMTQNLSNIVKAMKYGAEVTGLEDRDKVTIPKLTKSLVPIANNKGNLTDGMSRDELAMMIRTVKVNADLFDNIATRLP